MIDNELENLPVDTNIKLSPVAIEQGQEIKLFHRVVRDQQVPSGHLSYRFKLNLHGVTVYANGLTQAEFKTVRRDSKIQMARQKELGNEAKALQKERQGIANDLKDDELDAVARDAHEARLEVIAGRIEAINDEQEEAGFSLLELFDHLVEQKAVCVEWTDEGQKQRSTDVLGALDFGGFRIEVGNALMEQSLVGSSSLSVLERPSSRG